MMVEKIAFVLTRENTELSYCKNPLKRGTIVACLQRGENIDNSQEEFKSSVIALNSVFFHIIGLPSVQVTHTDDVSTKSVVTILCFYPW